MADQARHHPYVLAAVAASLPGGAILTDLGAIIWRDDPAAPVAENALKTPKRPRRRNCDRPRAHPNAA